MHLPLSSKRARPPDAILFQEPRLWATWPFLPLVRLLPDGRERQLGVLYDARQSSNTYGYSATVFLTNMFLLPHSEEEFLALPKCVYDTVEELIRDGWIVD